MIDLLRNIVGIQVGDRVRLTEDWIKYCSSESQDFWRSVRFTVLSVERLEDPLARTILDLRLESCSPTARLRVDNYLMAGGTASCVDLDVELADD